MLTEQRIQEIFDVVRRYSTADEIELLVTGGRHALTRFANNTIHQNVAEENYVVSVRSVMDRRTARATTNKLDDASLKRTVAAAEAITRVQQPDSDLLPMAEPADAGAPQAAPARDILSGHGLSRHVEATARITAEERAESVRNIVEVAKRRQLTAAGIYACSDITEAIVNSRGLAAFHRQTQAEISITMLGDDSSGWQKANSPDVANLDAVALAEIAGEKAAASAAPRELPPGKYTVVLEPAAVLDLVGFMFMDFAGMALLDQRSFLNNRFGTQLFGENISIADDAYHPLQSGTPFDGEGVRRQRVELVERGTVRQLVYARATAERVRKSEFAATLGEVRPTGHGFALPNEIGEAPMNIVFELPAGAPTHTVDQMVASTERGILVTRMWYIREVDPYEKILTGMTRDGTFVIENGKLAGGVRNFRFNQSLIEMLRNVEQMSAPVRASGEEAFDMVVPAMKVRDFNFTEVTRF
jgi:predicted Zn-dependent protease